MKEISTRKQRFLRVSQNRLARALSAIGSIENLANKSNYEYDQNEVNHISGRLMAKVKMVMSSFGSASAQDRFQRLVEQDQLQYDLLKETDPAVYELVSEYLNSSNPIQQAYSNNKDQANQEDDLLNKFRNLYQELEQNNTPKNLKNQKDDFFILDPGFDMQRLTARHNIDRLLWLRRGRTFKEITSRTSPYRLHPDRSKQNPLSNLRWDIKEGRVIQSPNNSKII